MGAMTACMGESNEKYSSKEIKFNITKRPNSSIKMKMKIMKIIIITMKQIKKMEMNQVIL